MTMNQTFSPFITNGNDAPAYWFLGCLWIVHSTAKETNGQYSLIEQWMPEGGGPPPHVHPVDEMFFVIEGEMTVKVGEGDNEKILVISAGGAGNVPRNTVHSFKTTKGPCRVLNFYTPAGLELTLTGLAVPAESRTLPPKGFDKQPPEQLVQFFNNYWSAPANVPWAIQE
jgi:mannose-6-phosphate isomerase-like protein (cupin superfamily)